MKFRRVIPILLAALLSLGAAEPTWKRTFMRRGSPLTKRFALVLDASGSMRGRPIQLGRQELVAILGFAGDDGWVRAYRFGDTHEDFGGWRRLPDAELMRDIDAWLSVEGTGSTYMIPAMEAALSNEQSNLSVVLVTDGNSSETNEAVLEAITAAQKRRKQGPVPIHVIAVWETPPNAFSVSLVEKIAEQNGGALVAWRLRDDEGPH